MKSKLMLWVVVVGTIIACLFGMSASGNAGKFFKISLGKVVISNGFTFDELEHRNGKLYIEVVSGKVLDKEGNGREELPRGKQNYRRYHGFKSGTKVTTVYLYNPNTNWTDDIIYDYTIRR